MLLIQYVNGYETRSDELNRITHLVVCYFVCSFIICFCTFVTTVLENQNVLKINKVCS